jgi:tetratricopeptide (TPR) repeat protein
MQRAATHDSPAPPAWTMAWLSGQINRQNGRLLEAAHDFRKVLDDRTEEMIRRDLDFSQDYDVINLRALTLFDLAKANQTDAQQSQKYVGESIRQYKRTLKIDSENFAAHYNLTQIYEWSGEADKAEHHRRLHERYRPDDNAGDRAQAIARSKYPWANHAAASVVIYDLKQGRSK